MNHHPKTTQHNWTKKLEKLLQSGVIQRGQIYDVQIQHDDWCDLLNNNYKGAYCNCDPLIIPPKIMK